MIKTLLDNINIIISIEIIILHYSFDIYLLFNLMWRSFTCVQESE